VKTKQSEELEARFLSFGVAVIKLTLTLKQNLPFSVIDQVIRSSTSIGANYSEAQNASSRADFKNKIFIAKKEASETRYWLRVIAELTDIKRVALQLEEIQQILLILQKITNTLRDKALK
jgi:four helix bundle protein